MIDPNIALSYRPTNLGIDTPTQTMAATQQLSNLQNVGKLQQQEVSQNDIQLKTLQATNQAIQANTKTNPDGTVAINHQGVAQALAGQGLGVAAQQYLDAQTKRDQQLTTLSSDKLDLADKQHGQMIEDLAQVLGAAGEQRAQLWKKKVQKYQSSKTEGADALNPDNVPDDPTLTTLLTTAKEGRQVIQSITAQKAADTQAKREENDRIKADAMQTRAEAYDSYLTGKTEAENWKPGRIANGIQYLYNTKTGEEKKLGPVDLQPDKGSRGAGGGPTANEQGRASRSNDKAYRDAQDDETTYSSLHDKITSALKSGTVYVNETGKVTPFASMTEPNEDGKKVALSPEAIAGMRADMRSRLPGLEKSIANAVAAKNNAIQNNGGTPQVSTGDAVAGYQRNWQGKASSSGNGGNANAQPAASGGNAGDFATKPFTPEQGKYAIGSTVSVKGQSYKVKGYNRDGSLKLTR